MKEIKEAQMGIITVLAVMLVSMKRRLPGTRKLSSGITTLALAGIVLLVAAGGASANGACIGDTSGTVFGPGSTVTESCTFNASMDCSGSHGLQIGNANIVIDGDGFTLNGTIPTACTGGTKYRGIYSTLRDNVTIKDLEIKNFCIGIEMKGNAGDEIKTNGSTIDNCKVHDNGQNVATRKTHGIFLWWAFNTTIKNCEIYDNTGGSGCSPACENGGNGIFLKVGNDNIITNNDIYGNKLGAYLGKAGPRRLQVTHNHIWGNHMGGIIIRCKSHRDATIEYNNVSGNYGTGIFIGGPHNTVIHNKVCNNMDGAGATLPGSMTNGCGINLGRNEIAPSVLGARWTNLTANVVCDNGAAGDILVIAYQAGYPGNNTGIDNVCDSPDVWNDTYTTGCTYSCGDEEVVSCNDSGCEQNAFCRNQVVYAKGYMPGSDGGSSGTDYKLWIQDDAVAEGYTLTNANCTNCTGTCPGKDGVSATSIAFSCGDSAINNIDLGIIGTTSLWSIPADAAITYDEYDIVADNQEDGNVGTYDAVNDGIDAASVFGFVAPVPELATFVLFGLGLLGLIGYVRMRRD
jgi:hypothetical protein